MQVNKLASKAQLADRIGHPKHKQESRQRLCLWESMHAFDLSRGYLRKIKAGLM